VTDKGEAEVAVIESKPVTVDSLIDDEERQFVARMPKSIARAEEACQVLAGGVTSSWMLARPAAVWISHGQGSRMWDVDGTEYVDLHGGFGTMLAGHAHPAIVAAVRRRVAEGTHFAQPVPDIVPVAAELARRFGLPMWRFTNSGTESTMDAIHLARAATGRDVVLKIEGSYHGHHDAVMVSVRPPLDQLGERGAAGSVPFGAGHPRAVSELTKAIPFNDADLLERVLDDIGDQVAALILEPAMMNITIVAPKPGYLERVRELTAKHGVVLVFDEVKTGATIAAGGAVERFGVEPDVVCLAKAIAGGYPSGAVGMTETLADLITTGNVRQVGTFNGNPLSMAAAQAALTEVLTAEAYPGFEQRDARLRAGLDDVIERYGLPCHTVGLGSKGCVVFSSEPLYEYRDYATKVDEELSTLSWLYHMNHGIFMTPGVDEQWTLSVAHSDDELQRYVDAYEAFARDVTA
jgi:glutamate-1-semialdehyde 2,1-aminomutase